MLSCLESPLLLQIVRKLPSVHPMNERQEKMTGNRRLYVRKVGGSGHTILPNVLSKRRAAFRAITTDREMNPAIIFSPKPGPESAILPQPFLSLVICESWPAALVATNTKEPDSGYKADQRDKRRPEITQWPSDKTGDHKNNADERC